MEYFLKCHIICLMVCSKHSKVSKTSLIIYLFKIAIIKIQPQVVGFENEFVFSFQNNWRWVVWTRHRWEFWVGRSYLREVYETNSPRRWIYSFPARCTFGFKGELSHIILLSLRITLLYNVLKFNVLNPFSQIMLK